MHVPICRRQEFRSMKNLLIVSGFKGRCQSGLICVLESDAIVWHRAAIADAAYIKGHGSDASGSCTTGEKFVSGHKILLTEVFIICSIRCWHAGFGVQQSSFADLHNEQTFFHYSDIQALREVVQWIFISGHHDLAIKGIESRRCGSPFKFKFLIFHGA